MTSIKKRIMKMYKSDILATLVFVETMRNVN